MFPIETTILRQRPWPAFLIMAIGVGIFFIPGNQKQNVPIYVGIGIIVLSIGLYLLISKTRVIVDDSGITHKTIFKTKEIPWSSISKTYLKSEHHGKSRSLYWYFENTQGKKTKFSIDLLSRKSLRVIAEGLTIQCKNADIEKRIYDMAEGQFPWYIW
jgi:hypothetical protein